jgi:hypothetical protein
MGDDWTEWNTSGLKTKVQKLKTIQNKIKQDFSEIAPTLD